VDSIADLRAKLIQTAESVKDMHAKIAAILDALAVNGDPEHIERRQALAAQARVNTEVEATHIDVMLRGLDHEIAISSPNGD
jgi:septal ring factor EnvC (AmiA/AmiB activator)